MKEENKPEVEKSLDYLFKDVRRYAKSTEYAKLLEFASRFKQMGFYNAIMVNMQRPKARFVTTASEWRKKYNRGVRIDAVPIVTLIQFGPIVYNYDIADTYPLDTDGYYKSDKEIIEYWENPFKTKGRIDRRVFERVISRLGLHGIGLDLALTAGSTYGGKIAMLEQPEEAWIDLNSKRSFQYKIYYKISVSSNLKTPEERASTIFHELGHFFCHHVSAPNKDWYKPRTNLTPQQKEFEAESVAYIVCDKLGIETSAKNYLTSYISENEEIPDISMDHVTSAVTEIMRMINSATFPKKYSYMYKFEEKFKQMADEKNEK